MSIILTKMLSRKGNKYVYSIVLFSFIAELLLALGYVFVTKQDFIPSWSLSLIFLLVLGGFGFGVSNFLAFELFSKVPASIGSVQLTLNRVVAVLFAFVFLNETLTNKQLIGAILLVVAVGIVSYTKKYSGKTNINHLHMSRALVVLVAMSITYAIGTIAEKKLLDRMGIVSYVVIGWTFQTAVVATMVYFKRDKWKMPPVKLYPLFALYVVLFAVSGVLFVLTLHLSDSSSKTISASGLKVVLSVIFAYVLLKERKSIRRIGFATAISLIGLWFLF